MPDLATPLIAWYREQRARPAVAPAGLRRVGRARERVHAAADAGEPRHPPPRGVARTAGRRPAALAADPPAEAVRQWANLGYPRRALWLHRAAIEIRDRHGGRRAARRRRAPRADRHRRLHRPRRGGVRVRRPASRRRHQHAPRARARDRRPLAARAAVAARSRRDGGGAAADRRRRARSSTPPPWNSARPSAPRARRSATPARSPTCARGAPRATPTPATNAAVRRATRAATGRRAGRCCGRCGMPRPCRCAIDEVVADWPDPLQRDRAIDSLIADGLAEASDGVAVAAGTSTARTGPVIAEPYRSARRGR